MDMIILNSNVGEISFVSGIKKSVSRADVEGFSFKEDPSVEQLLIQEYNLANEEYANNISQADKVFLEKKAQIIREYDEDVRHSMEVFSGELFEADNKKASALESICLEKEKLLKVSSEKLKLAKDRLEAYRENVKKLQEIEVLKETFEEEDKKAAMSAMISSSAVSGSPAVYPQMKTHGSGKLKF